jgi:hypothetical protein
MGARSGGWRMGRRSLVARAITVLIPINNISNGSSQLSNKRLSLSLSLAGLWIPFPEEEEETGLIKDLTRHVPERKDGT